MENLELKRAYLNFSKQELETLINLLYMDINALSDAIPNDVRFSGSSSNFDMIKDYAYELKECSTLLVSLINVYDSTWRDEV